MSCTNVDTVNNRAQALALLDAGLSVKDVAKQLGVNGLSKLHIIPSGETINAKYYVDKILKKELKPALNRQKNTGRIDERKLV